MLGIFFAHTFKHAQCVYFLLELEMYLRELYVDSPHAWLVQQCLDICIDRKIFFFVLILLLAVGEATEPLYS